MLHKAWNSKGEMPYCFPRSYIKFQGHTVQNITDFDPNWAFLDYRPVAAFKSLRFALFNAKITLNPNEITNRLTLTINSREPICPLNFIPLIMAYGTLLLLITPWKLSLLCPPRYRDPRDLEMYLISTAPINPDLWKCTWSLLLQ